MTEYIATTNDGWGRSRSETDAVTTALTHTNVRGDTVELELYQVEGFKNVRPGWVDADEVLSEETFNIDAGAARSIKRLAGEIELEVEEALVEG